MLDVRRVNLCNPAKFTGDLLCKYYKLPVDQHTGVFAMKQLASIMHFTKSEGKWCFLDIFAPCVVIPDDLTVPPVSI